MAFIEAASASGGGGGLTPTSLWSNSSGTSNFDAQTVTLSSDMSNFDYIGFRYRSSTSDSSESTMIVSYQDVYNSRISNQSSANVGTNTIYLGCHFGSGTDTYSFARECYYTGTKKLYFRRTIKGLVSGSGGTDISKCIPLEIIGYKL